MKYDQGLLLLWPWVAQLLSLNANRTANMRSRKMCSFPETGQHGEVGPRQKDGRMDFEGFFGP